MSTRPSYWPGSTNTKFGMTWKPTDHIDEQVRGWMRVKGWDVTATDYHFDQESTTVTLKRGGRETHNFSGPSGIRTQDLRIMSPLL